MAANDDERINNAIADHNNLRREGDDQPNRGNMFTMNPRDRLFHAIFIKVGIVYCRLVPKWIRTCMEIVVLTKAILLFTTLSYIHFTFSKHPMNCLDHIQDDWPRDGILVVQVIRDSVIMKAASKLPPYFASELNSSLSKNSTLKFKHSSSSMRRLRKKDGKKFKSDEEYIESFYDVIPERNRAAKRETIVYPDLMNIHQFFQAYKKEMQNRYIMEYSLEYGFLRLSSETRARLKIPIKVINLDPKTEKCFGDSLSRILLNKFLGYDDMLMASIKKLAEKEENKGYMRNVVTGEHYKFVSIWMGRASYFISLTLMFVFTICISTLLRFCHQQIFFFIVHLLQMLDWNVAVVFPAAPLFTVILSLVGMEAIMAEFFNDTSTSFYVILIVWAADQFDSVCCHTTISQKHWLRFFYLYHYVFYAYHYRFNGQYSAIALASSWFFIQHSMLYFLHNYELPAIEARANIPGHFPDNYLDDAVDILVNELHLPPVLQGQRQPPQEEPVNAPAEDTPEQQDQPIQNQLQEGLEETGSFVGNDEIMLSRQGVSFEPQEGITLTEGREYDLPQGEGSQELVETNFMILDEENDSQQFEEGHEQFDFGDLSENSNADSFYQDLHSQEKLNVSYLWRDSVMTQIKLSLRSTNRIASDDAPNTCNCSDLDEDSAEQIVDVKSGSHRTDLSNNHSSTNISHETGKLKTKERTPTNFGSAYVDNVLSGASETSLDSSSLGTG